MSIYARYNWTRIFVHGEGWMTRDEFHAWQERQRAAGFFGIPPMRFEDIGELGADGDGDAD